MTANCEYMLNTRQHQRDFASQNLKPEVQPMASVAWEITHSVETNASPDFAWHYWTNVANWDDPPAKFELDGPFHRVPRSHSGTWAGAVTLAHPRGYSAQCSHDRNKFGRCCPVV